MTIQTRHNTILDRTESLVLINSKKSSDELRKMTRITSPLDIPLLAIDQPKAKVRGDETDFVKIVPVENVGSMKAGLKLAEVLVNFLAWVHPSENVSKEV
jgi:hypothetical protein